VAADEADSVPFLFRSACAVTRADWRCGAVAHTCPVHLRSTQAKVPRLQHYCGTSAYTYAKSRDLNIDDAILACHFESILALLDGYAMWLQSGRQADNLVARIGKAETAPFPQIDPRTRDQYLRLLKQYLSWCVTRYIPRARQNSTTLANIEVVFADVADVIERRFESHIINARPDRSRYRSLTDTQLHIIRTLIRPGAAENPFPERLQLRNWLMIELLLETGIRRGPGVRQRQQGGEDQHSGRLYPELPGSLPSALAAASPALHP